MIGPWNGGVVVVGTVTGGGGNVGRVAGNNVVGALETEPPACDDRICVGEEVEDEIGRDDGAVGVVVVGISHAGGCGNAT